jgi:hypothetical protein
MKEKDENYSKAARLDREIREHRRIWRNNAIQAAQKYSDWLLQDYIEPARAGTPKGDPIGFSRQKMQTAHMMILQGSILELKDIAKLTGVSEGMTRQWRLDEKFNKVSADFGLFVANRIAAGISNIIDSEEIKLLKKSGNIASVEDGVMKVLKSGSEDIDALKRALKVEIKEVIEFDDIDNKILQLSKSDVEKAGFGEAGDIITFLRNILPFFNHLVAKPFAKWIFEMTESSVGYSKMRYLFLLLSLDRGGKIRDAKTLKKWYATEPILKIVKWVIEKNIELLADPKAWEAMSAEEMREVAKGLKEMTLGTLDILAT